MRPHVVAEVRDTDGGIARRIRPRVWKRAVSVPTAAAVGRMMVDVVQSGTGRGAAVPGVQVAGKTGTAQAPGGPPHAWFVAYAPADAPRVAVAVLVERGGDMGDEATGGRVAAPIAGTLLKALLAGGDATESSPSTAGGGR
jgi:peptidoglycan glycosyltransferase